MESLRDATMARLRFLTTLMLAFALVGVSLSVAGVYGVLAQLARNRTREMGVRMALGAKPWEVRWLVIAHGLRLTGFGLALGAVLVLFTTGAMTKLLFKVVPHDPVTLFGVAFVLGVTGFIAAWLPARSASRADPAHSLRAD
jgi:putative ABC transport system permease protein